MLSSTQICPFCEADSDRRQVGRKKCVRTRNAPEIETPIGAHLDLVYSRALSLGLDSISEPEDKTYDERQCDLPDAFGHVWWSSTSLGRL